MILEMLNTVKNCARSLTFGMWTEYSTADLEGLDVILNVPPERILLAEDPCPLFEVESFICNAEETLRAVALRRELLVRFRK